jgi:hypothetical protein
MKVIDPATLAGTRVHARYCEGDHCCEPDGEGSGLPDPGQRAPPASSCAAPAGSTRTAIVTSAAKNWGVPSTGGRGAGTRRSAIPRVRPRKQPRRTGRRRPRSRGQPRG